MFKYWVNNSGNWKSTDKTHWSLSSGGVGGANIPTIDDDVVFDENSFTLDAQIINAAFYPFPICKSITFMNVLHSPTLSLSYNSMYVGGDIILIENMTIASAGQGGFYIARGICNLTTNGNALCIYMMKDLTGSTEPTLNLLDDLNIIGDGLRIWSGTLTTNDFNITGNASVWFGNGDKPIEINLGASVIDCSSLYDENGTNSILQAGTSKIICHRTFENEEEGGDHSYYDIEMKDAIYYDSFFCYGVIKCHDFIVHGCSYIDFGASWPGDDPIGPEIQFSGDFKIDGIPENLIIAESDWPIDPEYPEDGGYSWKVTKVVN